MSHRWLLLALLCLLLPVTVFAFQEIRPRPAKPPRSERQSPRGERPPKDGARRNAPSPRKPARPEKPPRPEKKVEKADEEDSAKEERHQLADLKSEEPLPHLADLEVPSVEQLHKQRVDWIALKGSDKQNPLVIVANQVFPRPDTLAKLALTLEELRKQPRPATEEEREKLNARRNELLSLVITLPSDAEGQIYEIPTRIIDRIIYHEDLIIRRAGMLADARKFRDAFELLFALEQQAPKWAGLAEQKNRLLFQEAENSASAGDLEMALTFLEELRGHDRNYRLLQERLGSVVDHLIVGCLAAKNYRGARHFLARLNAIEPGHEIVAKWTADLLAQCRQLTAQAEAAAQNGRSDEAVELIDAAARVWPMTPGLADVHRRLNARFQRLSAGVLGLAGTDSRLPFPTLANVRERRLLQFDLFEVDRIDDATHYRSRIFERWEPTDLGRRAFFTLKQTRARYETRPVFTASTLISSIASRLDPSSSAYDERLASRVESLFLRSPFELEVRFSQAPPRMEPQFRFPVTRGETTPNSAEAVLSLRFRKVRGNDREAAYRRTFPQPDGLGEYQLAELVERKYDTPALALQALTRGDVSMLPDLPTWAVDPLRGDPRFFFFDYALPTTHLLQFNPQSVPCKSRELRLAMSYAIDAPRTLANSVLHDPKSEHGRIVTAPFASTSYAYNGLVPPREYSLTMSASLVDAAKKRLKSIPTLRMLCSPEMTARSAAAEIVSQWTRVGLKVELVPDGAAADSKGWDVAYRTLRMEEPFVDLWPFLTLQTRARLEDLRYLPDWLRLELLDLDNTSDWKAAVAKLQQLHAHLFAEVECIPLWEVADTLILRKTVHDFPPTKFVSAYQDIERWVVQSWFPEDIP